MRAVCSWRARIIENALWLAGSFLIAVFVWYAAVSQQNPILQQRFNSRVSVTVLRDEALLVMVIPDPVQVVVRAPRSVWESLDTSDISVTADLRGKPAGRYGVTLAATLASNRLGEVSDILPGSVTVELVKRSEAAFNILVTPVRPPPVGFEVATSQLGESSARVTGSEEAVRRVASVVARVDLADQTKTVVRTLPVLALDSDGRVVQDVSVTPGTVETTLNIQPRPGVTVMKVKPNLVTSSLPLGYLVTNYSADPTVVAVRGDRTTIESLNGEILTDPVSMSGKTGSFTQTVKLALPSGVTLTDPVNVVVSVQIDSINITREFANVPVIPQGLDPADFQITIQPQTVTVLVRGPLQAVNSLQASELTVTAPLTNLAGGTHTVTLQASVAHDGLTSANASIPNAEARVVITALRPTPTSAATATRPPTFTPQPGPATATTTP